MKITVKENENIILPVIWSGKEKEVDYHIQLVGINSNLTFLMLLLGKKEDKVKIHVNIDHKNIETKSKVIIKGIIRDGSDVDFNGLVRIERGSKGSNTLLSANLLLLSDRAKGRVVPSLEILENDVKARHSTAIGKINDEELFYLMSRGINKKNAQNLIVKGFLNKFLQMFPEGALKEEAERKMKYEK